MSENKEIQERLDKALAAYQFSDSPKNLYEPIRYILSLGAKRLRPQLLLMGCELFGGDSEKAIEPALGIEFFHNFTLMHDDIMDNAPLRRAKKTVHQKWNTNIAILSGDAMFVQSFQLITHVESQFLKTVIDIFCKTAIEVCEGQQLDMDFESNDEVSIEDYLHMITLKTAVLLAASLYIGATIGKASRENAELLYAFGKNMGIAFQLQDDYLDVYGDSSKVGKQTGGDIISNKKTFLLLKAFALADKVTRIELQNLLMNEKDLVQKVNKVKAIYDKLDVKNYSEDIMKFYFNQGLKCLDAIQVEESKKSKLLSLANNLLLREH